MKEVYDQQPVPVANMQETIIYCHKILAGKFYTYYVYVWMEKVRQMRKEYGWIEGTAPFYMQTIVHKLLFRHALGHTNETLHVGWSDFTVKVRTAIILGSTSSTSHV